MMKKICARFSQFNLETDGYHVDVAYSAEEALKIDLSVYNLCCWM